MIMIYILPIYILMNFYIFNRIYKYLKIKIKFNKIGFWIYILTSILISSLFIISFIYQNRFLKILSNYWFGIMIYLLMFTILMDIYILIRGREYRDKNYFRINSIFYGLCLVLLIYGFINANIIRTKYYDIKINKNINDLKIALISDIHLGYNTNISYIEKMVEKIDRENPDIIIIAGDIFDNDYNSIKNPELYIKAFNKLRSTYGTYAAFGNHDTEEKILGGFTFEGERSYSNFENFLEKSNIKLLSDESILINDFYLIGRKDGHKPFDYHRMNIESLIKDLDQSKPLIVIDHEPNGLLEMRDNNIDLVLSGHTHNGQLFPLNLFVGLFNENSYGVKKLNNTYDLVTSGIGVWGPKMRTFTSSEIVIINLKGQN